MRNGESGHKVDEHLGWWACCVGGRMLDVGGLVMFDNDAYPQIEVSRC